MKTPRFRKMHLYFSSLLLCLLHLPFAFAKNAGGGSSSIGPSPLKATFSSGDAGNYLLDEAEMAASNNVYNTLKLASCGMAKQVFDYGMRGFYWMKQTGKLANDNIISIVDFSKPSSKKRLFIIDLKNQRLLFNTYVAHGVNSGKEYAQAFSNLPESNKSSLGFYKTAGTYIGKHGYSLHINGMEKGINDNAFKRDIVVHGANYVAESYIQSQGYIGRSWGCPAVPEHLTTPIINKIKNGTCLFIFGQDKQYLSKSVVLRQRGGIYAMN